MSVRTTPDASGEQAFVEAENAVHPFGKPLIVRRDQRGGPLPAHQPQELIEHAIGGGFVEIAGGFVGQHQRGTVGERAGDGDALLLAAR